MNILPSHFRHCEDPIKTFIREKGLEITKPIGKGCQGTVYGLQDITTAKISHVLKVTPPKATLTVSIQTKDLISLYRSGIPICSPTHLFYLTSKRTISTTPEPYSVCIASIMPYIEGDLLEKNAPKLAEKARLVFHFGAHLADALDELSAHGVEHSDLNTRNIMLDSDLKPIVIDFDLAVNSASLIERCFIKDREAWREHMQELIQLSSDIKPGAKLFLKKCLLMAATLDTKPGWMSGMPWFGKKITTIFPKNLYAGLYRASRRNPKGTN